MLKADDIEPLTDWRVRVVLQSLIVLALGIGIYAMYKYQGW